MNNQKREPMLTDADAALLKEAFRAAIKEAAPDIAEATTAVIHEQLERAIGRGVVGWVKRIALAALLGLIGYTYIKTGGN
jgi:hypothetical protein